MVSYSSWTVKGAYKVLEDAKAALNVINSGYRLIAEVDGQGNLNRDPSIINGYNQVPDNGFNRNWYSGDDIKYMMDICQTFLDDSRGKL